MKEQESPEFALTWVLRETGEENEASVPADVARNAVRKRPFVRPQVANEADWWRTPRRWGRKPPSFNVAGKRGHQGGCNQKWSD